ncbi:MAG TPA: prepilin peptidase [Candidatus Moranbacteria bacterium]|nr:prepilin peptidase [Candidatus Moranbacteria bacterium]
MIIGIFVTALFFLGLIFGSFANVLIDRGQRKESLTGRSKCDSCNHQLRWLENIPVISFLFLRGRCSSCKNKINWQYPLVELVMAIQFSFVGWYVFSNKIDYSLVLWQLIFLITISFLLLVIFIWDFKYLIIPNGMVAIGLAVTFFWKIFIFKKEALDPWDVNNSLWQSILGGLVVSGFFYLLWLFSRGRWIGGGDVKLGAWLGFLVGWKMTYFFLLLTYLSGAIVAIILLLTKRKKMSSQVPFGPFLIFSATIILFWQQEILNLYHKFLLNLL